MLLIYIVCVGEIVALVRQAPSRKFTEPALIYTGLPAALALSEIRCGGGGDEDVDHGMVLNPLLHC